MSRILLFLLRAYGCLLAVAAGGFLGAQAAGFLAFLVEFANPPQKGAGVSFFSAWVHGGWCVGAAMFAAAGLVQWWRKPRNETRHATGESEDLPELEDESAGRPIKSRIATMALHGVGGGFLGMFLGASLLLLWFSLAYSPFGPTDWANSISLQRVGPGDIGPHHAATTNHPVAVYAFGGPILLGAIAGVVMGAFPNAKVYISDK